MYTALSLLNVGFGRALYCACNVLPTKVQVRSPEQGQSLDRAYTCATSRFRDVINDIPDLSKLHR